MADLKKHFEDMLKDVYYAEKQIYKALPKMIKAASNEDLSAGFEKHREQTQAQIERLERVFEMMDMPARGKKCPAIDGILEEGAELIEEHDRGAGLDAALAAAAQAVEHYEIARYGTLCSWCEALGMDDVKEILGETLDEEEATDETLSELAIGTLNPAAVGGEGDDDEGDAAGARKGKPQAAMKAKPADTSSKASSGMQPEPRSKAKAKA